MQKVLVLGSTGMLGSAVAQTIASSKTEVLGTSRQDNNSITFDANTDSVDEVFKSFKPNWIINCIGIIKPYINESDSNSILNAIYINSIFPFKLSSAAASIDAKVIQIATDCVYSGSKGAYKENDLHDATDVYGKTKSLGEVPAENMMHIRASIIGPELGRSTSLLEWFKNQPINSKINGFTDHLWNGITTHAFGKLCAGIIKQNSFRGGRYHVTPRDTVTKADLLRIFSKVYKRSDLLIKDTVSPNKVDRTLSTNDINTSNNLWKSAGYDSVPSIEEMVFEQAGLSALFSKA
jgi:dTDP-4-dehydrorhamnose reductase